VNTRRIYGDTGAERFCKVWEGACAKGLSGGGQICLLVLLPDTAHGGPGLVVAPLDEGAAGASGAMGGVPGGPAVAGDVTVGGAIEGSSEVRKTALCVGKLVPDIDVGGGEDADEDLVGFLGLCGRLYYGG
jgi:hypothetical protein